jgi:hypothetical protein
MFWNSSSELTMTGRPESSCSIARSCAAAARIAACTAAPTSSRLSMQRPHCIAEPELD